MIEISLPWPKGLTPNVARRGPMSARSGHETEDKETAREACALIVAGGVSFPEGDIPMEIVYSFPTLHQYDSDACVSVMKAMRDGLATALGVDDGRFWPLTAKKDTPVKGGRVVVRLG